MTRNEVVTLSPAMTLRACDLIYLINYSNLPKIAKVNFKHRELEDSRKASVQRRSGRCSKLRHATIVGLRTCRARDDQVVNFRLIKSSQMEHGKPHPSPWIFPASFGFPSISFRACRSLQTNDAGNETWRLINPRIGGGQAGYPFTTPFLSVTWTFQTF